MADFPDHTFGIRNIGRDPFATSRAAIMKDIGAKRAAREATQPAKPTTYTDRSGTVRQRGSLPGNASEADKQAQRDRIAANRAAAAKRRSRLAGR